MFAVNLVICCGLHFLQLRYISISVFTFSILTFRKDFFKTISERKCSEPMAVLSSCYSMLGPVTDTLTKLQMLVSSDTILFQKSYSDIQTETALLIVDSMALPVGAPAPARLVHYENLLGPALSAAQALQCLKTTFKRVPFVVRYADSGLAHVSANVLTPVVSAVLQIVNDQIALSKTLIPEVYETKLERNTKEELALMFQEARCFCICFTCNSHLFLHAR
jgi:hypothetical protein